MMCSCGSLWIFYICRRVNLTLATTFVFWNSLFTGAATFEGIVSEREHVNDGEVPQECHHLQGERDVSDHS